MRSVMGWKMNLSEIDFIQVVVRIRGKFHMVLLNEATKRMLPELIADMEGKIRLLETELPFEEISIKEMKRISEMSSARAAKTKTGS